MALAQLPATQHAIQQDSKGRTYLNDEAAVPPLPSGYILVKSFAVGLNPSDHKLATKFPIPGAYIGGDFSKHGTLVSGVAIGFNPRNRKTNGTFAEYVRIRADLVLRLPGRPLETPPEKDLAVGPLEAATLGAAVLTCILALWSTDGLGLTGTPDVPDVPDRSEHPIPVLVYGGSTATGTLALQLLELSGYNLITTCSPRNLDLVRSRGATTVFDYAASDVAEHIKARTGGRLKYTLDCISDTQSVGVCYASIQRPGGRYVSLEMISDELLATRRAIHLSFILAAEAGGEEAKLGSEGYDRPASR
ncbi:zinc-binding dehydrogenase [Seiridium cupressi]